MVQRKAPNKLGIKPHLHKSDTQLVNLRPSSPQTHDKLKKIMKKSRPVKRSDDFLPFKKKRAQQPLHEDGAVSTSATPQKRSPNYMKSTSSFEARKERSPSLSSTSCKTQSPKASEKFKTHSLASGQKGSQASTLKVVRTLTKTTSFKPSRPKKKCSSVILCEDLDAQRATCSSTLKDSKFPKYIELSPGGTELEGTSAMKVCPYTYCSLNGHHHAPILPLRCFLSARRRALKTQKSFTLGCLSPRHTKPVEKKKEKIVRGPIIFEAPEEVDMENTPIAPSVEEESRDFFVEIYSKDPEGKDSQDSECSDIDWEVGHGSVSSVDDGQTLKSQEIDGDVKEEQTWKTGAKSFYSKLQDLYDEESVTSGAWTEENGDSESDSSYLQREDQDFLKYDAFELTSTTTEADVNEDNIKSITEELEAINESKNSGLEEIKDELQGLNLPVGDRNIKCCINYEREKTSQDSETVHDFAENSQEESNKRHTTIIYNIIQFNISVFVNGENKEQSEMDKGVTVQVPATDVTANKMETEEVNQEQGRSNEDDAKNLTASDEISKSNQTLVDAEIPFHSQESISNEQLNANEPEKKSDGCLEDNKHSESLGGLQVTEQGEHDVEEINEEPATRSGKKQTDSASEITSQSHATNSSLWNERALDELPDPSINLRGSTQSKKLNQEVEDSKEFNPRGPNFLPEVPDPDAETVDLRHQMMDERKNAEEWMVDFALQQAVTTLAPERKRKVALLVEAFEKVMPIPKYETHNRHTSKAFTNARPMQACS